MTAHAASGDSPRPPRRKWAAWGKLTPQEIDARGWYLPRPQGGNDEGAIGDWRTDWWNRGFSRRSILKGVAGTVIGAAANLGVGIRYGNRFEVGGGPPLGAFGPQELAITTFAPGHGWVADGIGQANLNDTRDAVAGTQHASLVTAGNGRTAQLTKTGLALGLNEMLVRVRIKIDDATHLRHLFFYTGNSSWSSFYVQDIWDPAGPPTFPLLPGLWQTYTFDPADGAGKFGLPNLADISNLRMAVIDDGTGHRVTFHAGGVSLVRKSPRFPHGAVSLTFDDGFASQCTLARPTLDRYGFAATAYVILDLIDPTAGGRYLTLPELEELQAHGWEIAAHATTAAIHNAPGGLTVLNARQLDTEFATLQRWLRTHGFRGADNFAYPQGLFNELVLTRAENYFTSARCARHCVIPETLPPTPGDGRFKLRISVLDSSQPLSNMIAAVDGAYAHGTWLIFMGHEVVTHIDDQNQVTHATFDRLVDHIARTGIPVLPLGDVLRRL